MTDTSEYWLPLRTERLVVRDFRPGDAESVHRYGGDPEVARFMDWGPNTPEETEAFLARSIEAQAPWPRLDFGLGIELEGEVVGSIGLHLRDGPNRTAETGYCLRRDLWRRGVISEAARALLDVAFGTLGLHRVFATCDVRNSGSFGVMEAIGMRREGLLRQDRQVKGAWRDTLLYAVLADEWRPSVANSAGRASPG